MKTLKFSPELVGLIINGTKTCTWRLFDDKDLKTGDILTFLKNPELTVFATAKITQVKTKMLKDIDEADSIGHEKVGTKNQMYKTYSKYYNREISPNEQVKIIRFKIVKFVLKKPGKL